MSCKLHLYSDELHLRDILDFTFRFNPAFKLVEQGEFSSSQFAFLKVLNEDLDHFDLLLSDVIPELGVLVVNRESAQFFLRLKEPGKLLIRDRDLKMIAGLVLDGILQVEWNGHYVTGPAACDCLFTQPLEIPRASGKIPSLSFVALQYAQGIPSDDPRVLSSWLYKYNSLPMSPIWAKRFANPEYIDEILGLQLGGPVQSLLREYYTPYEVPGWHTWQSLKNGLIMGHDQQTFKLYVSPHPSVLPEAFSIAVRCVTKAHVISFKIGRDAFGLLRPDKLIIYFLEYDALNDFAKSLTEALAGCPAQGVPFTAAISEDGLLSWGIDPPQSEQIPGWRGNESWRVWVTDRLARSILRARVLEQAGIEAWHYAMLRLSLFGIHIPSWLPNATIWVNQRRANE